MPRKTCTRCGEPYGSGYHGPGHCSRYVTALIPVPGASEEIDPEERYALYRLCRDVPRGERPELELVATCATPEAVGVALVVLALEDEFADCPIGLMDRLPKPGDPKWLIKPWLAFPTPKQASDAGRTLRASQKGRS